MPELEVAGRFRKKGVIMKEVLTALLLLAALPAGAQGTNSAPDQSFVTEATRQMQRQAAAAQQVTKANQVKVGRLTMEGSLVEAVKTRRPLELINPFAPPEYGSPMDNVAQGPITQWQPIGLKLFSLRRSGS